jgi:hypothetical protein
MERIRKFYISLLFVLLFAIGTIAAYALTSVEIKSYPDATDSATVISNKLSSIAYPYLEQILEGNIPDHIYVQVRGHSHSIGTADQELSALGTAGFGNWPAAAAGAVLVSTDVDDDGDPADTGARTVIVRGLDENWALASETVTMNGTTPTAATTVTFIRIHEIEVVTAGSSLTNEGQITASISGTNIIAMYAIHSTSESGRYTIPAGYTGYFQNLEGSGIGNKEMTYHIFCRDNTVANSPFLLRASWHSKDGGFRPNGRIEPFTQKIDLVFVAHAELAGATASASVEGWVEAD